MDARNRADDGARPPGMEQAGKEEGKRMLFMFSGARRKNTWLGLLLAAILSLSGVLSALAEEQTPATGVFENPELAQKIDEAAEEAAEVGWSELRIPLSVHGISQAFISPNAIAVGQQLIDRGYQAYLTGGAVRDMILNKSVNDFDIATDAPLELWQELFGDDLFLHGVEGSELQYGLVHYNGEGIDLASLCNVPAFLMGLPGVPETDPEALTADSPLYDSYGRDLTINALYYDLATGDILDYHGGLRDIQDKVIRVLVDPHAQLANRPAQMIRYLRFLSRYEGSRFSPDLESVMQHCLDYVGNMDPSNAQNQLRRMWIGGYAVTCFDTLLDYGLLGHFYKPVAELCADEAYLAEARAALAALDAAYDKGEDITTPMGTAAILLPAVRRRLDTMSAEDAVEAALAEMDPVYGFYGDERDLTAQRLLELLSSGEAQAASTGIFANEEINRMIDENYQRVQEEGYAELRIPMSLHGITDEMLTANSIEVGRKLMENGYEAYVVGGCIRDFILGTDSNDIDITTNATLEQQRAIFGDALETHWGGGRVFGGVIFPNELVDLATYQNIPAAFYGISGVPEFDPSSTTSDSLVADSFQRDLTMNAIYYDMSNGDLVDYHGGIHDLRDGVLNTMVDGSVKVQDDPRAILRAIRFKARFGFEFSDSLERAIREYGVAGISTMGRSDVVMNASKMMVGGYSSSAWRILADYGLLDALYPPLIRLADDEKYLNYLDKGLMYIDQLVNDSGEDVSEALALLAFLQPEIDRRAQRSGYETALCGVLDEQETSFILDRSRPDIECISLLAHDMEQLSSRFLKDAVRQSEYFEDARALLNIKAQTNSALAKQAEFWNEADAQEAMDALDDAA